jgi:hypothetical protein
MAHVLGECALAAVMYDRIGLEYATLGYAKAWLITP